MCKFTDAIPTGSHAIKEGSKVILGAKQVVNVDLGTGKVTKLDDKNFDVAGDYSYNIFGMKGSGTFTFSLKNTSGDSWDFDATFTGTNSGTQTGTLTCKQSGSGDDTTITYSGKISGNDEKIVQSYQNDSMFEKAKIWFDPVVIGSHSVELYFYNADYS